MREQIPEKTIITCDACRSSEEPRKHNAHLIIKRDALDACGRPCANANVKIDLCDSCHDRISAAVNAETNHIRGDETAEYLADQRLRAMLNLFMCCDPWPADQIDKEVIEDFLDDQSRSRGYDTWVDAYHQMDSVTDCGAGGEKS